MYTYGICDPIGVASEGPHDAFGVCIHNQNGEVITYHTQHGTERARRGRDKKNKKRRREEGGGRYWRGERSKKGGRGGGSVARGGVESEMKKKGENQP